MWRTRYKDYSPDSKGQKKERITGKEIIGCEMNEHYGWGESHPIEEAKPSLVKKWLRRIFKKSSVRS